jgi:DNA mismatch repair protein MutL
MPRIQQLPATLVNQIAAGEVVERPASVVKELLENAVDAGSSRIDVEVEKGGTHLIRVVDDGGGIEPDDLPLAFASHATSKLAGAEGLFRVGTLGFRGEALASVGSVAQVNLQSRPPGRPHGAEVTCHGGQLSPVRAWNGAPGTRVEVRHLFYNTPVRRKFLRAPATEMAQVAEAFTRLALSPRAPGLTLRHNGKAVHEVPLSSDLLDRVGLLFGDGVREKLYPVEARLGAVELQGYVGDPGCDRGNAGLQYLYVNGRWVRDRGLAQALQEAYRGLLMAGRHAVAFLFVELPPEAVDVNVHPTKAEVRFREPQALQQLVLEAVRDRLRAENLTARLRPPAALATPKSLRPPAASGRPAAAAPASPPVPAVPPPPRRTRQEHAGRPSRSAPPTAQAEKRDAQAPLLAGNGEQSEEGAPGPLKAMQLHGLYLVVEVPEGMLVIDQHALHERILFEQLRERLRAGTLESQRLLVPEPVTLPAAQAAQVLEHREALAELGLGVEDFGGGTVLLTGYPALLGRRPPGAILQAVVDYLAARGRAPGREQLLNDLLSLMACHGAVRAGDRLTPEEIAALVAQRDLAGDAHHCPHGRPTSLLFSHRDLERQFRRA